MLEGGGHDPGSARRVRTLRRRRQHRRLLLAAGGLALLALTALFGRRLLEGAEGPEAGDAVQGPAASGPGEAREPAPFDPLAPAVAPPEAEPLPPLAGSDAFVRERAAAVSTRPELSAWLAGEGLVSRFVAAVDNVANGETPREHLRELDPQAPFQAAPRSGRYFVSAKSWSRYDLVSAVFGSLDPEACARLHQLLLPLFEQAYGELGRREGSFDDVLARAVRELLRAPVRDGEIEVVPAIRSYRYADPELEALSPAQKQLLRMGARNARAVQAKLGELATALDLDVAGSPPASPAR